MASDVVEFQKQTFLTTFDEVKPKLSDTLATEFEQIRKRIEDADEVRKNVWSHPWASSSLLPFLNDLNVALAECTVFAEQCQDVTRSFSRLNPFHQALFIRNMKQRLKTMSEKFDEWMPVMISELGISSSPSMAFFPTGRYTSFESKPDSQLIGFDEEEKKIEGLISDNSYKAIGVYGMAGSGKTALILKVLNNPSVQNQFSPIIWLCLSDIDSKEDAEQFEVNIVKFILCELGCDVDKWTVINPSKGKLLTHLKSLLMTKKYLIVFDDVWENNKFYSNLGDALPVSDTVENRLWEALPRDSGGKIIITSRQKEVGKNMVGENNLICMKPLSRESCRMILEDEIGFTGYAKEIEGLLSGSGFVSIGIYGPSSSANTALVRKALSSSGVREKFQPIIWVPVSLIFLNHGQISGWDDLENVGYEIMKHMLKELGCDDELTKNKSHFELGDIVKRLLTSKKYMIVLADVVHESYDFWGFISSAWPEDGDSSVIVTSKIKEVTEYLVRDQNLFHLMLPELGSNEGSEVAMDRPYISDDIVDQCGGLPFAVKTLVKIIQRKGHYIPSP